MSAVAQGSVPPLKDLYEIGEIPPLGHVPEKMHAWVICKDRHGPPDQSMQIEVVPTWPIGEDEVLVLVMAAGVNYNGVGGARPAGLHARRAQTSLPHRRLRCRRYRLGDRQQGASLEGRRRGHRPLRQVTATTRVHSGDPLLCHRSASGAIRRRRLLRSSPRAGTPIYAQAESAVVGDVACFTLMLADRLPHAHRVFAAHGGARATRCWSGARPAGSVCWRWSWWRTRAKPSRSCQTR